MPRYWTINGRFLTQKVTGVQRYGREIVRALDALVQEGHPLTRGLQLEVLVPDTPDGAIELGAIPVRRTGKFRGHIWEQVTLPRKARGGILSLCNTTTLFRGKQIVCIHDLNFIDFPSSYSRTFRLLYRMLLPVVARKAAIVTTVSDHSRLQLAKHCLPDVRDVVIVPNGHEHTLEWIPRASPSCALVDQDTVVLIGSPAPHKNLGLLLTLSQELAGHGIRVAIAGSLDMKVFADGMTGRSEQITWLGRLSDDELADVLAKCLCLAFPSFTEGFGLPPLEAMARGCPVVVSDRASLPEVCGDAALYASPDKPQDWLSAFLSLRNSQHLRADLIRRGLLRASHYSWRRSAELYLMAMVRADALNSRAEEFTKDPLPTFSPVSEAP